MGKILIVYYSRSGITKKLAERLAEVTSGELEEIVDKKDRKGMMGYLSAGRDATLRRLTELSPLTANLTKYDLVVVGTPI